MPEGLASSATAGASSGWASEALWTDLSAPSILLALYVVTSLTIPFWVPILKRVIGDCGMYWVFSVLTYYAYLAWLIFAALLALLLYRIPIAGVIWAAIVCLRVVQFVRLGARSPARLVRNSKLPLRAAADEEAPLPVAREGEACVVGRSPTLSRSASAVSSGIAGAGGGGGGGGGGCAGLEAERSAAPAAASCCSSGGGVSGGGAGAAAGALGRVLLVGNGPSIRERGLGGTIDGFDTVVRFNSFVTKGLEEHTGSRTSLWCHMMQWYHVSTVEVATPPRRARARALRPHHAPIPPRPPPLPPAPVLVCLRGSCVRRGPRVSAARSLSIAAPPPPPPPPHPTPCAHRSRKRRRGCRRATRGITSSSRRSSSSPTI